MTASTDLRPRYQARIAGRLAELHSAKALAGPLPLSRIGVPPHVDDALGRLVRVCVALNRARQLLDLVVPAALREPGRLFARRIDRHTGNPRGAIDWPKTVALRRGREGSTDFEFVCRSSHRNLVAPENLLLLLCVEDVAFVSQAHSSGLELQGLWGRDGKTFVARIHREVQTLLSSPAFRECRLAAREARAAGEAGIARLEAAVAQRVASRPSAAPEWAGSLMAIRADLRWLPRPVAEPALPLEALWLMLAHLEMLSALRAVHPIRQSREQPEQFACGDRRLRPVDGVADWVLLDAARVRAAVSIVAVSSKDSVRYAAFERLLDYQHESQRVDRWVVLHSCLEPIAPISRNGLEVRFVELPLPETPAPGLRRAFADWFG